MRRERLFFDEKNSDLIAYSLSLSGGDHRPEIERMKRILMRAMKHELTVELNLSKSTVSRHIKTAKLKLRKVASYYQR